MHKIKIYSPLVPVTVALLKHLLDDGWTTYPEQNIPIRDIAQFKFIVFNLDTQHVGGTQYSASNAEYTEDFKMVTIDAALQLILKNKYVCHIGDHEVRLQEGGIKVGCQFVPQATIDLIYNKTHSN